MTSYLYANNIRIFDFSNFSQPLTEQIWDNAQRIADENPVYIYFLQKGDCVSLILHKTKTHVLYIFNFQIRSKVIGKIFQHTTKIISFQQHMQFQDINYHYYHC